MDSTALTVAAMKKRDELRLTRQDVARAYKDALGAVSVMRGSIPDETRQLMADAVREFYRLLEERIEAKRDRGNVSQRFDQTRRVLWSISVPILSAANPREDTRVL